MQKSAKLKKKWWNYCVNNFGCINQTKKICPCLKVSTTKWIAVYSCMICPRGHFRGNRKMFPLRKKTWKVISWIARSCFRGLGSYQLGKHQSIQSFTWQIKIKHINREFEIKPNVTFLLSKKVTVVFISNSLFTSRKGRLLVGLLVTLLSEERLQIC